MQNKQADLRDFIPAFKEEENNKKLSLESALHYIDQQIKKCTAEKKKIATRLTSFLDTQQRKEANNEWLSKSAMQVLYYETKGRVLRRLHRAGEAEQVLREGKAMSEKTLGTSHSATKNITREYQMVKMQNTYSAKDIDSILTTGGSSSSIKSKNNGEEEKLFRKRFKYPGREMSDYRHSTAQKRSQLSHSKSS